MDDVTTILKESQVFYAKCFKATGVEKYTEGFCKNRYFIKTIYRYQRVSNIEKLCARFEWLTISINIETRNLILTSTNRNSFVRTTHNALHFYTDLNLKRKKNATHARENSSARSHSFSNYFRFYPSNIDVSRRGYRIVRLKSRIILRGGIKSAMNVSNNVEACREVVSWQSPEHWQVN